MFWWYIASQELTHAVHRKAQLLYTARERLAEEPLLQDAATLLDVQVHQLEQKARESNVRASEAYRVFQNRRLMIMWMLPVIAVYAGCLAGTVVYNQTRTRCADDPHHLSFGHWGGLCMVFFSYVPEILFFLFVIEWLVPVGDYEVIQRALNLRRD